jgi:hypothetical protein
MPKVRTKPEPAPKRDKPQYDRFLEKARELGVDDEKSGEAFEQAFKKIVPPKPKHQAKTSR